MIKVSYSKVSCYLDCPCRHHLRYIQRLRLKKPEKPLYFGSDFHKLLEFRCNKLERKQAYKQIKDKFYEMPSLYQMELGDNYLDDLKTIFNDYRRVWKGFQKPIETEHEFLIHMSNYKDEPVYFHGIIDEVYDDLVMGEHKTFKTAPSMDTLAMNMQTCLYSKAWELETGQKFQRVMWDYIKRSPAAYPIWLEKSQRFSAAKNNNITSLSWERACIERGITDEATLAMGEMYLPNLSNFFFRCYTELLPIMVDTVWEDFKAVVRDIIVRGPTNKIKNIGRQCSWCGFRPICYAEFTGVDINYIIKTDYEYKEEEKREQQIIQE